MMMRVLLLLALVAIVSAQVNSRNQLQGTWSNGKRSQVGGNLFICVDPDTNQAHGTYGNAGYLSGFITANQWIGQWYEAGYDRPLGSFAVTVSDGSFSGTWTYFQGTDTEAISTSFSGSRSSNAEPSQSECQSPATTGLAAQGTYEGNNDVSYVCYQPNAIYQNTKQLSVVGHFQLGNFGSLAGYTPDNGVTNMFSDFNFVDDDENLGVRLRPEGNDRPFGTGSPAVPTQDDDDNQFDDEIFYNDDDDIQTQHIVVSRLVASNTLCVNFWRGFYNEFEGEFCYQRTSANDPTSVECGSGIYASDLARYQNNYIDVAVDDRIESLFANFDLPPFTIVAGPPGDPFADIGNAPDDDNQDDDGDGDGDDGIDGNDDSSNDDDDAASVLSFSIALLVVVALAMF